ncbi:permease for cytosine/purines, uracil, thiamine, allantoin-domain-containing protein [Dichomitus squalens]|uniref:Permease for cytosine/purines, uracil, thiamine, allantoin-domain-containing protein n=1 Tax=Dichomitus squalens TaxID=114155 RepID=A0A4Q9Q8R3_9APHY|nr:permease for cytosine/purines, uracil, thiamine, allantoin-domain-containing protein [Dichomitus squalens]TBU63446.1 permease for cytosine/purines, uracil, thiamine, allantoin-domain-containing protein [Dichomitus squalens]
MLIFDDIESTSEKEKYPPSSNASAHSRESKENLPDNVLVVEEENVVQEAKTKVGRLLHRLTVQLARWGLEVNGITPIPEDQRTDRRLYQFFFVWFSANANILTLSAGTVGPAFFNLGILDSFFVIVVVDVLTCPFPAMFATFGPKLGTRSMVQARFSWGYYGAIIPSILNVLSMQGYLIVNTIIGGQTLAEVSDHLNATLGIIIIALISLIITFCGCKVLHWYALLIWIPNIIAFIVMLAVGGMQLREAPLTSVTPASAATLMTFGASLAATVVSWATLTPDYGVYHDRKASTWRLFFYAYLGFIISSLPAHMLGAAFAAASQSVPSWSSGLGDGNDVGGLIAAVLAPTGKFGKFLLVWLSLTAPSACAPSMYTACTSFMTIHRAFARLPRFVVAVISTAILIPVAIVGAGRFYETFETILALIGYWIAPFCAVVLTEHFLIRRTFAAYNVPGAWDNPRHPNLPTPYPALCAFAVSIAFIVLCMQQQWWTGPVARQGTGDLGMLLGFVASVPVYAGARYAELNWSSLKKRMGSLEGLRR